MIGWKREKLMKAVEKREKKEEKKNGPNERVRQYWQYLVDDCKNSRRQLFQCCVKYFESPSKSFTKIIKLRQTQFC